MQNLPEELLNLLSVRKGHFLLESGHHGTLWLDLELLCHNPRRVQPLAAELATRLSKLQAEIICGPLVEGAFVGLMAASELNVAFAYSERFARPAKDGLFPAGYRIPDALRNSLPQKRVAIVNDVINAGSAVRGTFAALEECGSTVVGIGALLVLGTAASEFASQKNVVLETLATLPNDLWQPPACPLCSSGVPLEDVAEFRPAFQNKIAHRR
jgi:orotate phosphoribosyltransferase